MEAARAAAAAAASERDGTVGSGATAQQPAGGAPAETVETRLPLPAVDFAEPLLSLTADFPPSAVAGKPFRSVKLLAPTPFRNRCPAWRPQDESHDAASTLLEQDVLGLPAAGSWCSALLEVAWQPLWEGLMVDHLHTQVCGDAGRRRRRGAAAAVHLHRGRRRLRVCGCGGAFAHLPVALLIPRMLWPFISNIQNIHSGRLLLPFSAGAIPNTMRLWDTHSGASPTHPEPCAAGAGPRQSTVAVLPHSATTVAWQLVPVAAGSLALPSLRIAAPGWHASLDASAGRRVFVVPPQVA